VSVRWAHVNALVEARRFGVDFIGVGESRVIDAELVADADAPEVRLAATAAGWIAISTDNGTTYHALGTDVRAGLDVGPMVRGERKAVKIKVAPPAPFRQRRIGLLIGGGT